MKKRFNAPIKLVFWVVGLLAILVKSNAMAELAFTEEEQQWIAEHPEVVYGIDAFYAPIEMLGDKGEHTGLSSDYIKLLSEKIGISFVRTPQIISWADTFSRAVEKDIDMLVTTKETENRQQHFNFTQPYIFIDKAIIARNDSATLGELTIEDMHNKKVAVVSGYFWDELLPVDHSEIKLLHVNSLAEGLLAVAFGQADAMFATYATATHYISENNITNLSVVGLTPYKVEYSMAVRKDWPILQGLINRALASVTSLEKKNIIDRWIRLKYRAPWYNKRAALTVLVILIAACLTAFVWTYSLRRQVKLKTLELQQANQRLERIVEKRTSALRSSNNQLKEIVNIDGLTRVFNRHYLDEQLRILFSGNNEEDKSLSLIMVDVDFFKLYNDTLGHVEGDKCLIAVAQALAALARRGGETFARYGGEEFVFVLPGANEQQAKAFANAAVDAVGQLKIEHRESSANDYVSISAGYVAVPSLSGQTVVNVFSMADQALYYAKSHGRNQSASYLDVDKKVDE